MAEAVVGAATAVVVAAEAAVVVAGEAAAVAADATRQAVPTNNTPFPSGLAGKGDCLSAYVMTPTRSSSATTTGWPMKSPWRR